MSITIKAYLKIGENPNGEIRRFVLNPDACTSFEFITKKLMQVFPSLANEGFDVAWKDSEGDLIAFSSDEELVEAVGQLSENVFRIFIQKNNSSLQVSGQIGIEYVFQPGFACHGCEMEISSGPLFKCVTCPKYVICKKCEKRGIHSEHNLLKIRKPKFGSAGQEVNLEQQIISPWPCVIVEDGANQYSIQTTSADEFNATLADKRSTVDQTPPLGAIKGPGRFLDPEEVLKTMISKEPSSDTVPCGFKEDVYFLINNSDNYSRQQLNKKSIYVDDCGAWGNSSLKTHYYILNRDEHKLVYMDFKDGVYFKVVKKQRAPLDPQPEENTIIAFKRYYLSLKRGKTYRKRISTVFKCPEDYSGLKCLAVAEYVGAYPHIVKPHGNCKKSFTEYVRSSKKV